MKNLTSNLEIQPTEYKRKTSENYKFQNSIKAQLMTTLIWKQVKLSIRRKICDPALAEVMKCEEIGSAPRANKNCTGEEQTFLKKLRHHLQKILRTV